MNISYKREMRHNYLILEAAEAKEESFEIRMLTENSIEGLLKFRIKQEEMKTYYYYEITSKQPLSRLLEFKEIKREELSRLIMEIGEVLKRIEDYLLSEANLFLEPEHIYIEPESYQVWLCYIPGYDRSFPEAMEKFLQYLLKKTNHKDNGAVVLAYRLYQESQKDYYGIEDLLRIVRESQQGTLGEPAEDNKKKKSEEPVLEKEVFHEEAIHEKISKNRKGRKKTKKEIPKENKVPAASAENNHKRTIVNVFAAVIGTMVFAPLLVWLYAGIPGLLQYQAIWLSADICAAAGGMIYLWKIKSKSGTGKTEQKRAQKETADVQNEKEWQMVFEDDFVKEEGNIEREIMKDNREDIFWESKDKEQATAAEGEDTVLLAEASLENEPIHWLKSVNPSVPDISVPYFPFIIGKQEGIVDYVLKKDTISRIHLRIDEEDGNCKVTDLNSSNGTMIENYRLEANESHSLCSGDKLIIADISFIFY